MSPCSWRTSHSNIQEQSEHQFLTYLDVVKRNNTCLLVEEKGRQSCRLVMANSGSVPCERRIMEGGTNRIARPRGQMSRPPRHMNPRLMPFPNWLNYYPATMTRFLPPQSQLLTQPFISVPPNQIRREHVRLPQVYLPYYTLPNFMDYARKPFRNGHQNNLHLDNEDRESKISSRSSGHSSLAETIPEWIPIPFPSNENLPLPEQVYNLAPNLQFLISEQVCAWSTCPDV
ncbi:hypothetical protein Ciccas_011213 [Cichlidogyrus casuarinus]|uniref:Uncharacterized protein n=1 Tax=Cichlidogyrus casuarinus TaxID=1844966 RepID=A0ABD2PTY5_9PLAT